MAPSLVLASPSHLNHNSKGDASMTRSTRVQNRSTRKHASIARAANKAMVACLFEDMEARQLMSAQLFSSGNLTILGTPGNDSIVVGVNKDKNRLTVNDN